MLLLILLIGVIEYSTALGVPQTFLWNSNELASIKKKYKSNDPDVSASVAIAINNANACLIQGPWSVMNKKFIPPSGDKHDYMSLDKYYWPCNVNPNGTFEVTKIDACDEKTGLPYVRHDGYTNPEMHLYDHDGFEDMLVCIINLGTAYYYTENEDYVLKGASTLNIYFVDTYTKMNPNLNFGHFIPGVVNGSHGATIDLHSIPEMLDAIALLRLSANWPTKLDPSLNKWFGDYLNWLWNSTFGKQERAETNNHAVWYDVQTAALALHTGNTALAQTIIDTAITARIEKQIEPDGELPAEEARTKSWSYCEFALDAFFHLGLLSTSTTTDLFNAVQSRIRTALDWQFPYVEQLLPWPFPQVEPFIQNCTIDEVTQCIGSYFNILRIASDFYQNTTYENEICKLPNIDCHKNMVNLWYEKKF